MAELVKAKVLAAKVGVTMTLLGLIAGITGRPRTFGADPAKAAIGPGSIGTRQVKDHSLQFKDFKFHQVLSFKDSVNRFASVHRSIIVVEKDISQIQGNLSSVKRSVSTLKIDIGRIDSTLGGFQKILSDDIYSRTAADARFLLKDATAANANAVGGITPAHIFTAGGGGQVVTGTLDLVLGAGTTGTLLAGPSFTLGAGAPAGAGGVIPLTLQNVGAGTTDYTIDGARQGGPVAGALATDGATALVDMDEPVAGPIGVPSPAHGGVLTIQLRHEDGGVTHVTTITITGNQPAGDAKVHLTAQGVESGL